MSLIFNWDARLGSFRDLVSNTAGSPTLGQGGFRKTEKGMALLYDGADTKLDTELSHADLDLTGDISIEAWIKPYSIGENGYGRVVDNGKVQLAFFNIYNKLYYSTNGSTLAYSANDSIILNKWQHVIVTRSSTGDETNFYIDNQLSGAANQSSGTVAAGTTDLIVGNRDNSNRTFDGLIGKIIIHNKILSQEERDVLYEEYLHSYNMVEQKTGFSKPKSSDTSREVDSVIGEDLIAPLDFTSGWSGVPNKTSDSFTTTGAWGLHSTQNYMTLGSKYIIHIKGNTTAASFDLRYSNNTVIKPLGTGTFDEVVTITAADTNFYLRNSVAGTTTITTFTIQEITGLEASYNMIPSKGGVLIDTSGNNNTGQIHGALATKDGMAFKDLGTDNIQLSEDIELSTSKAWTLAFRLNPKFTTTGYHFASDALNNAGRLHYSMASNAVGIAFDDNGASSYFSLMALPFNLDNTLIYSCDGNGNITVFINGFSETKYYTAGRVSTVNNIGGIKGGTTSFNAFSGVMIDVKFYNYEMTWDEKMAYHNSFRLPVIRDTFKDAGVGDTKTIGWENL